MIKGIFKLCSRLPKYLVTYDLDIILHYRYSLPTNNLLSMALPTKKLCTLHCLLNGQRSQTISSLKVDRSVLVHGIYTFYINTIKKNSKTRETSTPWFFSHLNLIRKKCFSPKNHPENETGRLVPGFFLLFKLYIR